MARFHFSADLDIWIKHPRMFRINPFESGKKNGRWHVYHRLVQHVEMREDAVNTIH